MSLIPLDEKTIWTSAKVNTTFTASANEKPLNTYYTMQDILDTAADAGMGSNADNLGGVSMRTIYSRANVVSYVIGTDQDLMGGSSNFGSRNFKEEFFTNSLNYDAKAIHFRVTGVWGSSDPTPDVNITIKFGDDILNTSTITGAQANGHPVEIMGEIMFENGNAICCYSIAWCENNGTLRRYALSNPSSPIDVSAFTGGNFQLIMESTTTNTFTSYLGYIQVWN
jgi:hypothetical protein